MISFDALLAVAVVAATAPLLAALAPRLRIPAVVLEIVAGIVLGPAVLGWITVDVPIEVVALVGLAFLLFLAGLEIDLRALRGGALRTAGLGYLVTLAVGALLGLGFGAAGWIDDPLFLAVALSATSLGLVVPVLKDAGLIDAPAGQATIIGATVADFAAVVLLSLVFSMSGGSTGARLVLLVCFVALVVAIGLVVSRIERVRGLSAVFVRLQDTTAAIRIRWTVVLLLAFVVLAERFGLESILGAFLAGAVVAAVDRDATTHPHYRLKVESIGFGFLIPVFFVTSGLTLDLGGLLDDPAALARVPLFLLALLLARGLPALLQLRTLGRPAAWAVGLQQSTSLPFLVTASQIGTALGTVSGATAAALVCAGLLSVLIFPSAALSLVRPAGSPSTADAGVPAGAR
jgi:Kef-type K+ transport system membrane component KefB